MGHEPSRKEETEMDKLREAAEKRARGVGPASITPAKAPPAKIIRMAHFKNTAREPALAELIQHCPHCGEPMKVRQGTAQMVRNGAVVDAIADFWHCKACDGHWGISYADALESEPYKPEDKPAPQPMSQPAIPKGLTPVPAFKPRQVA